MPEPNERIGPYRLVAQLGRGAMGEVWRARDERLDRHVALKVLPAELASDPERRARMLREARAAAAIRHANVVTLYDVVEHDGADILVMELVEGKTVSELLRRGGAPSLADGLSWIEQIAGALAAAHERRILHRDIKSANVMVAGGVVKVLDFGLAKVHDPAAVSAGASAALRVISLGSAVTLSPEAVELSATETVALDATMPSSSGAIAKQAAAQATVSGATSYETHAGALLGTPMYMAPEQIAGGAPDARSEVFSVGVLAYEILSGVAPYSATTLEALFEQILAAEPPRLAKVPEPVAAIVARALAKDPADRFPSMQALQGAVAAERERLFAPRARRWPILAALAAAAVVAGAVAWWWLAHRAAPERPGDVYVARALEEYDVFYNDKALSSLRAALRLAPLHPRANAYMLLFGGAPPADRAAALDAAHRALAGAPAHSKDRALLAAAIDYAEQGAPAARAALLAAGAERDRELAFWAAELDYRAGRYADAGAQFQALLAEPAPALRGRIYDHDTAVLLYLDEPAEALRVGAMYKDAFPGEADAVGVYATTLAAAGKLELAAAAAEDARALSEGEDTLAGLAKALAIQALAATPRAEAPLARAIALYAQSLDRAGPSRRPVRRAALGFLQWIAGDAAAALATVTPCLPGGADATAPERGMCLFVAAVIDPSAADAAAGELDALAAGATPMHPAYGDPAALAKLVRARAHFFGGGCVVDPVRAAPPPLPVAASAVDESAYAAPVDFYGAYHVPFFATYAVCEHAALLAARGDKAGAAALLKPIAERAPNRTWLVAALAQYQ